MKILHAAETITGGVAAVMSQLVDYQISKGLKVKTIIPKQQKKELSSIAEDIFIPFSRTGRNLQSLFLFTCVFISSLFRYRPDVVHLHSSFAGVICRIVLFFIWPFFRPRIVYCPHAFSFLMISNKYKKRIYILIERILLCITDAIICVSNYEKNKALSNGFPESKLHLIYNGVPVREIFNISTDIENDQEKTVCLFVGRFDYQKGYDLLLKIVSQTDIDKVQFVIVGDYVNDKQSTHNRYPSNVISKGWVTHSELENIFSYVDVVIVPSRWEGFAMVPLEAMSHGVPVLAADTTSLPEVVIENKTGYLFSLNDLSKAVNLLNKIDRSHWEILGENAKAFVENKFSSDKMLSMTSNLYDKLML